MKGNSNVGDDDLDLAAVRHKSNTGYVSSLGSVRLAEEDLEGDDNPSDGMALERPLDAKGDKEISETVNNINVEAKTNDILTAHVFVK